MTNNLIHELGGPVAIAKAYDLKPNQVSNWIVRGVPWRYRSILAERANDMSVKLPDGFLDPAGAA